MNDIIKTEEVVKTEEKSVAREQSYSAIEDLIGMPPGFLLRSGIAIVGLFTITMLSLTYFISYPDKISCRGNLTSSFPPIELVSKAPGYVEEIFVKNNTTVQKGEPILSLHSTTNVDQLDELKEWIKKYKATTNQWQYLNLDLPKNLNLGNIQKSYAQLQLQFNGLKQELRNDIYAQKVAILGNEINKIEEVNKSKNRELSFLLKEMKIVRKDQSRNNKLFDAGAISEVEFENIEKGVLNKERELESISSFVLQNDFKKEQLALEQVQLQEEQSNNIQQFEFILSEIIANIEYEIAMWSESFLIKSTMDGVVSFATELAEKKAVMSNEVLAYIIPENKNTSYISARLPHENIGKIESGQRAILKFDAYPYKQFGSVDGLVKNISQLPERDASDRSVYEVIIPLKSVIRTDYDKVIESRPKMSVQVEIITEERSLFERIFDQFLRLTKDI